MSENHSISGFMSEIKSFLKASKDDFIVYPKGIETVLDERISTWNFQLDIQNTCNAEKQIALFSGLIDRSRYQILDGSKQYAALGGGLVATPYAAGTIIRIDDNPRLLNKVSELSVHAIATQTHHNGASEPSQIKQVIYKDGTGQVTITSKDFFIDFLQEFVKHCPLRIFEFQVSTSSPTDVFSSRVAFKDLNPLNKETMQYINLEDFAMPESSNGTKIIVPSTIYVGDQTFMAITVPALSQLTFSMRVGAYHSDFYAFKNKLKGESFFKSVAAVTPAKTSSLNKSNVTVSS